MIGAGNLFQQFHGYFQEPSHLWMVGLVIPLILLYLIRPRPKKIKVPSLMFLLSDKGKGVAQNIYNVLLRDLLFIIQCLILILLAFAAAQPYVNVSESLFVEEMVFVIDASASSQAPSGKPGSDTRFEKSVEFALDNLGSKNTLIVASGIPEVVFSGVDADQAKQELRSLKPTGAQSSLYDAVRIAGDASKSSKSRVVVLSDFALNRPLSDLLVAKKSLESKGMTVDFVPVYDGAELSNVAIVDAKVEDTATTIKIKNFDDYSQNFAVVIDELREDVSIEPNESIDFQFKTPSGQTEINLDINDDFALDNKLYISGPTGEKVSVLVLTNNEDGLPSFFLNTALQLIPFVEITTSKPPKVPELAGFDIVILDSFNPDMILPGTVKNMIEQIEAGTTIIVRAQERLFSLDFKGTMPVIYEGEGAATEISESEEASFTKDINFGSTEKYIVVKPRDTARIYARASDGTPMIASAAHGQGHMIYYGIFDDQSSFSSDYSYALFWKRLIESVTGREDLRTINKNTGGLLSLGKKQLVQTPQDYISVSTLVLNDPGFYSTTSRTYAANLISMHESNIEKMNYDANDAKNGKLKTVESTSPLILSEYAIYLVLLLLLIELAYIKYRGDI